MALPLNFPVDRGSDFEAELTLREDDGSPINLNNFVIEAKFSKNYVTTEKVSFTVSAIDLSAGKIKIKLSPSQTAAMKLHRYVYDVKVTAPLNQGGAKTRVLEGLLYVNPGVT